MHTLARPSASPRRRVLLRRLPSLFAAACLALAGGARAEVWLNETFEAYAAGVAPDTTTSPLLMSAGTALVVEENGGKLVRYAKPVGTGGLLQYALSPANSTPRPRGFISFKIRRNPDDAILATHIFSFRIGPNDNTTTLGAEANAFLSVRFYQTSSTTNLRIYSTNGTSAVQVGASTTYNPTDTLQTVRVWYNDDESQPLAYVDPSGNNRSLNPNSFVVYLGNTLVTPNASGSLFNSGVGANLNIGKIAFVAASNNGADMTIDEIYAADSAPSAEAPVFTSAATSVAYLGVPYSFRLVADGATSFTATPLPAGLTLDSATGIISGTPTALGLTTAAITATNAFALTGSGSLAITVEEPTANTFSGANPSLNTAENWSYGQAPNSTANTLGSYQDLLLDSTATALTTSSNNIYARSWNVTNGRAYTVAGTSATQTNFRFGTTGATDTAPFSNLVSGELNDFLYLSDNSSLTFLPDNPTPGAVPSVILLRNSGNLRVEAGSTFAADAVIADGVVSSITKLGAGTATFRAANTYRGGTIAQEGVLRIENPAALGTGVVTLAGGTIQTTVDASLNYTTTSSGAVVINGPSTLDVGAGATLTVGRVTTTAPSSANLVTKTGPGTLRLSSAANAPTVAGGYRVAEGTLIYNASSNAAAGVGPVILDGGDLVMSKGPLSDGTYSGLTLPSLQLLQDAVITLDPNPDAVSGNNTNSFTQFTTSGSRLLRVLKGPNARSSADTPDYADPVLTLQGGVLTGTTTIEVGTNAAVTLTAASGAGAGVVKTGPGRLAVSSAIAGETVTPTSYSGPTSALAGTLAPSGAHASSFTVGDGAALEFALNDTGLPVATTAGSLTFATGATVRIVGTPAPATSYPLFASAGLTGTPALSPAIEGYALFNQSGTLVLAPATTGGADTTPPVITLNGSAAVTVSWGSGYTDAGASAIDDVDGSVAVQLSGTVNPAKPGVYVLTYSAADTAGNAATPVQRTVTVVIEDAAVTGPDGLSPLLRYALGATSPGATVQLPVLSSTATALSLTAVVRTDDSALTVVGEAVTDLAGTWGTGGAVSVTLAADQTGLPAGCVRRVFTVQLDGAARKFLRLRANYAN
ncbi:MAG: DUF5011 domain-containing protein [Opitutaceae bacterium]|nr:DUF5011 domain-containing protein [Opitutaceae bacterium]